MNPDYAAMEKYKANLNTLVASLRGYISDEDLQEVEHLFDHNENGLGLQALAWIIVEKKMNVPHSAINLIQEYIKGLSEQDDMPENLASFGITEKP